MSIYRSCLHILALCLSIYATPGCTPVSAPPGTVTAMVSVCLAYDPPRPSNVVARTDPDGHTSRYAYDQYGDLTSSSDRTSQSDSVSGTVTRAPACA